MRIFRDYEKAQWQHDAVSFGLGAIGGLAIGVLISQVTTRQRWFGTDFRERASAGVRRLRPARLRRLAFEQRELDRLEDDVLSNFLADPLLSERAVDIGAISGGIIELSGWVTNSDEAQHAVALANSVAGVHTVVNRLNIENSGRDTRPLSRRNTDDSALVHSGAPGGMGKRRQSYATDPPRPDDSQHRRDVALAAADQDQFADEGFSTRSAPDIEIGRESRGREQGRGSGPVARIRDVLAARRTGFSEDEMDNQDPHGKHAAYTLDAPPEALNTDARVGEALKPGTRRALEGFDKTTDESGSRESESDST